MVLYEVIDKVKKTRATKSKKTGLYRNTLTTGATKQERAGCLLYFICLADVYDGKRYLALPHGAMGYVILVYLLTYFVL